MVSSKRKYDEIEGSDSDEPSFGRQILPVADLPHDFDGEPMDGMQYLFTVRRDAKALPQFTRAVNPYQSTLDHKVSPPAQQAPHPALPSAEWRECSEKHWRYFHKNFNQPTIGTSAPATRQKLLPDKGERDLWWEFLAGKPTSVWNQPKSTKKKGKQQQQSDIFAEGRMRAWDRHEHDEYEREHEGKKGFGSPRVEQGLVSRQLETPTLATDQVEVQDTQKTKLQDFLPTPTGTPVSSGHILSPGSECPITQGGAVTEEEQSIPREPTPQLLSLIDERMALHLLMYFTFWIHQYLREPDASKYRLTNAHARWITSLLLRVDVHISADDMNLLRNLARACLAFVKITVSERKKGSLSDFEAPTDLEQKAQAMGEQACWIIISGVVGIWNQRDLWTNAEDALSNLGDS